MRPADLFKLWMEMESLDEEMDTAEKGDAVEVPEIRGLKINGKRWTLKDARLVCESD